MGKCISSRQITTITTREANRCTKEIKIFWNIVTDKYLIFFLLSPSDHVNFSENRLELSYIVLTVLISFAVDGLIFSTDNATQYILQVTAEFLSTDTVQEKKIIPLLVTYSL